MTYPWALAVTYVDVENDQFLTLGGAAFKTKRERDANLGRIQTTTKETDFVLDIKSARGIEDDSFIESDVVQELLGNPISTLISKARAAEEGHAQ